MECPICLDVISSKDLCITECEHTFHSKCMFESIVSGNLKCPCCRFQLVKKPKKPKSLPMVILERSRVHGSEIVMVRPLLIANTETLNSRQEIVSETENQNSIMTFFRNFIQ